MVRCSKSILTTWFVASALCGCTYDFDRFAPGTMVGFDSGQSVAVPDGGSPSEDGGSLFDAQGTTDVSSSPVDASTSRESRVVCADSQGLPDAALNPSPSLKTAGGEAVRCVPVSGACASG